MSTPRSRPLQSSSDCLVSCALSDGANVRPALLAALTDLFVSRENPDGGEISRYEDMALRLLGGADPGTRAHVAARLARHSCAPVTVIGALLQSDRVCATILLEHCPQLSPELLDQIAGAGTEEEATVLARRKGLDPATAAMLSLRPEPAIHCALVENPDLALDKNMLARLIKSARNCDALAALVCRRIADSRMIAPLFLCASAAQRADILRGAEFANFTAAPLNRVETANEILINWIVERGRGGLWALVAQEIVRLTRFDRAIVDKMLASPHGDGLAVLLAAIGCPPAKAIRLFLSCAPEISHSCARVRALAHVVEHTPAHAAHALVHAIAGTPVETQRAKHVPLHDPMARATPGRALSGLSANKLFPPHTLRETIRLRR